MLPPPATHFQVHIESETNQKPHSSIDPLVPGSLKLVWKCANLGHVFSQQWAVPSRATFLNMRYRGPHISVSHSAGYAVCIILWLTDICIGPFTPTCCSLIMETGNLKTELLIIFSHWFTQVSDFIITFLGQDSLNYSFTIVESLLSCLWLE